MKIAILGSMQFAEKMIEVGRQLKELGHEPITTSFIDEFIGKTDEEFFTNQGPRLFQNAPWRGDQE